ncbi:MAG: glycosyltransferase family 2 protein [Planctomycetota bacterium]
MPEKLRPRFVAELHGLCPGAEARVALSVVAPVFDEEQNLEPLYREVVAALDGRDFELLLVDDGSRDRSADVIRALHARDPRVRGVFFARNRGQSAALAAGIHAAAGELIATLDADLQSDPADLPALIAALGMHDAVVGYRRVRNDNWLRRVSSRVANGVRNRLTGDSVRDTGCPLKLFRADAIRAIPYFDGVHRFLPTLLRMHGFDVIELGVSHRPRVAGKSKYGVRNRALRALRDTFAIRWMRTRTIRFDLAEVHATRLETSASPSSAAQAGVAAAGVAGPGVARVGSLR